jgi:Flp pilus assembly pilin Flp
MLNLYCKLRALAATRDQGVTTVEYALILLVLVVTVSGILWLFGDTLVAVFNRACGYLNEGASCG